MSDTNPAQSPAERLPRILKSCWKQGCEDLGALVGQPLKFRSESLTRIPADTLAAALGGVGVTARITSEGETPVEFRIAFTTRLALTLSGVLNVQRPEDIAARVDAGKLTDDDLNAMGQLTHILAAAFDEALRLEVAVPLHFTCQELKEADAGEPLSAIDAPELVLQQVTLAIAGLGEGTIYFYFPAGFADELAGGTFEHEVAESEPAAKPSFQSPPASAPRPARATPAPRPAREATRSAAADGARVLVAGPVAEDVAEMEQALSLQGLAVTTCPRLRDAGSRPDLGEYVLIVLVIPAGSRVALPLINQLSLLADGPPIIVATRRATPSLVFQSLRAGASYVVVLPPEEGALQRVVELADPTARAAA